MLISCTLPEAQRKADEPKQAFQALLASRDLLRTIGLGIGCTEVPPDAIDLDPLVRQADERMYRDKSASQGV